MTTATAVAGSYRAQRLTLSSGERTWTVLGKDHRMVGPAEEYLEYLRAQRASPNTVKSYVQQPDQALTRPPELNSYLRECFRAVRDAVPGDVEVDDRLDVLEVVGMR
ncbi:MAG: hypothetical protein ACRDRK_13835 [Pseudonocardia sp.]